MAAAAKSVDGGEASGSNFVEGHSVDNVSISSSLEGLSDSSSSDEDDEAFLASTSSSKIMVRIKNP